MELEVAKWMAFGLMGVAVWFLKRTIDKLENTQALQQTEIARMKEDYLHKNDFKDFRQELRDLLNELKQDIKELSK